MKSILGVIDKILNVVYPTKCVECGRISKKYLCTRCRVRLGLKIETHIDKYKNKNFKNHIYLFKYDGKIREKIIKYKFRNKAFLYEFFSEIIVDANKENDFLKNYDYVVPVPISKKRRIERGYNQSELIAKEISKKIEYITVAKIINKVKDNKAQSSLKQKERRKNVINVYAINEKETAKYEDIMNKKFLLIDDIFTTGNTVNEAARMLTNYGIKNIDVFTVAKD